MIRSNVVSARSRVNLTRPAPVRGNRPPERFAPPGGPEPRPVRPPAPSRVPLRRRFRAPRGACARGTQVASPPDQFRKRGGGKMPRRAVTPRARRHAVKVAPVSGRKKRTGPRAIGPERSVGHPGSGANPHSPSPRPRPAASRTVAAPTGRRSREVADARCRAQCLRPVGRTEQTPVGIDCHDGFGQVHGHHRQPAPRCTRRCGQRPAKLERQPTAGHGRAAKRHRITR